MRIIKNKLFFIFCFLFFVFFDQLIKWWMMKYHPSLILANRGVIFGWIENSSLSYSLLVIGFIVLIWLIVKRDRSTLTLYSLLLLSAGALSNLIDRLFRGYIIDYINPHLWFRFNLADLLIVAGVVLYGYELLRKK